MASLFAEIPLAPPDPILGLTEAFNADTNPRKVNLGVGVYQDETGRVPVLASVREAEKRWLAKEESKSYLPIDGVPAYNKAVQRLLLGADSPLVAEGRAVTVQGMGGTGALRTGAELLHRFLPGSGVFLSTPSWENHRAIFEAAGHTVTSYPYYDPATHGVEFDAMLAVLAALPPRSVVLLHACCHNPTGVDLSRAQWDAVVALVAEKGLVPFLDFAYQGFGDGIEEDAYAVRAVAASGIPAIIASSFSKSFSLYRERVGALTVLTGSADDSKRVLSQLKRVIRANISNPSSHGAQVVALVLDDPELREQWEGEVTEMRERIRDMRTRFVVGLRDAGIERDFSFVERQRGMFSYSGLELPVVRRLREEYGIYVVDSGRMCVAAMNTRNIGYICESVASSLRG